MNFFCEYRDIIEKIQQIDALAYAKNRNYLHGAATQLSPFITHGLIDTRLLAHSILNQACERASPVSPELAFKQVEKIIFQLAWRDFFHRVWQQHGDHIFTDLKTPQQQIVSMQLPTAIINAETGIKVLDQELNNLYTHGYVHNHSRLWIASLVANIAKTDWRTGARWMHHHLLDGDLASNSLSWQWVAGTFSQKRYLANQENINRFSATQQQGTLLDVSYEALENMSVPEAFSERGEWHVNQPLTPLALNGLLHEITIHQCHELKLVVDQTLYLRSIYNLNPNWHADEGQHVLLIEPAFLIEHPISLLRWKFISHWAKQLNNVQVVVGAMDELIALPQVDVNNIVYQQHSLCQHWQGNAEPRRWLFDGMAGDHSSFFKFWKIAQKQIERVGIADYFSLNSAIGSST